MPIALERIMKEKFSRGNRCNLVVIKELKKSKNFLV